MSNDGRQCISMLMSEPFAAPQVSFRGVVSWCGKPSLLRQVGMTCIDRVNC